MLILHNGKYVDPPPELQQKINEEILNPTGALKNLSNGVTVTELPSGTQTLVFVDEQVWLMVDPPSEAACAEIVRQSKYNTPKAQP